MSDAEFSLRGIPDKPEGLSHDESRLWDELINQIPAPVLKHWGGGLLRELCSAIASCERISKLVHDDVANPLLMDVFLASVALQNAFSPLYGLTPGDRAKMRIISD